MAECDKLAAQEMGDGDDNASRRRHDKLKDMLAKLEVCLFYFIYCLSWYYSTHHPSVL